MMGMQSASRCSFLSVRDVHLTLCTIGFIPGFSRLEFLRHWLRSLSASSHASFTFGVESSPTDLLTM